MQKLNQAMPDLNGVIVKGDCVEVMSALSPTYNGTVRCVYMDPPYRNGDKFICYDDRADHDTWIKDISSVLSHVWPLLSEDGSLWISIDDEEMAYLKVLCDTLLGRSSYQATVVWQHRTTRENRSAFSHDHEYVLVYAKDSAKFKRARNKIPAPNLEKRYSNPDNDPRGLWQSVTATAQAGHACESQFYSIVSPKTGKTSFPPKGRCWVYSEKRMKEEIKAGKIWFGRDGNGVPRIKKYLADATPAMVSGTLWTAEEAGTTAQAKKQLLKLLPELDEVFETPKPEQLLMRIIEIATKPGDLFLDPYLGSGTGAAVAHKMGRRYIGIEKSDISLDIATSRLKKVVDGERTGISRTVGWSGGGAFEIVYEPHDASVKCVRGF